MGAGPRILQALCLANTLQEKGIAVFIPDYLILLQCPGIPGSESEFRTRTDLNLNSEQNLVILNKDQTSYPSSWQLTIQLPEVEQ